MMGLPGTRAGTLTIVGFAILIGCAADRRAMADDALRARAEQSLRRAVTFFQRDVARHGGYVYRYSADLTKREGEGKTDLDTVWVQPPGTPTVGEALVAAYERTHEAYLLEAARAAGECLRRGQLASGGWTDRIEFSAAGRKKFLYRVDKEHGKRPFNYTTFDDNKTQSAVRMLARLDRALEFRDKDIHDATLFALDAILKAQFPNGGWAQGYEEFPDPSQYPVKPASFPEDWPREYPGGKYWRFYTFNDNAIADTIDTLLFAAHIYQDPRYRAAALRAGDFILLAQLPDPQPAWAQQYDFDMRPVWARKFEPPAVSGGESQGIVRALMRLYVESGDRRFLQPIPRALDYLQTCEIAPGRLARFYELRTNRPLYFTREYALTYSDDDLPTHYGFQVAHQLDELRKQYSTLPGMSDAELARRREAIHEPARGRPSDDQAREIIESLDERGAWVTDGVLRYHGKSDSTRRVIETTVFCRNVDLLSRFLRP